MANLPADLHKLLEWLDRVSSLLEAQIVAAGLNHTLDKALMRNFAEMNLREETVSITARGRDALSNPSSCTLASARALRRCGPRSERLSSWEHMGATEQYEPQFLWRLTPTGEEARELALTLE
jgi:hypothetical protein